jgi:phage terminase large subunit
MNELNWFKWRIRVWVFYTLEGKQRRLRNRYLIKHTTKENALSQAEAEGLADLKKYLDKRTASNIRVEVELIRKRRCRTPQYLAIGGFCAKLC